jgi:hypothetical protein
MTRRSRPGIGQLLLDVHRRINMQQDITSQRICQYNTFWTLPEILEKGGLGRREAGSRRLHTAPRHEASATRFGEERSKEEGRVVAVFRLRGGRCRSCHSERAGAPAREVKNLMMRRY